MKVSASAAEDVVTITMTRAEAAMLQDYVDPLFSGVSVTVEEVLLAEDLVAGIEAALSARREWDHSA